MILIVPPTHPPRTYTFLQEWEELASGEHRETFLRATISDALDTKLLPESVTSVRARCSDCPLPGIQTVPCLVFRLSPAWYSDCPPQG